MPSASGGDAIVIVAVAVFVLSVTETAVTVTVLPVGIAEGAVKVVAAPLAVDVGLNDPHATVPQVTVHLTPAFALSFATFAVMLVVAFTASGLGGCAANVTAIGCAAVIVIVAEADFVLSVTETAVMVTVFPVGTAAGAVKAVAAPLGVDGGLNDPHGEPPHVTVQFTPAFALSLATFAVIFVVVPPTIDVGGGAARVTEIACATAVIVIGCEEADFVLSVTEVAVMVTVFPVGTDAGAVKTVAAPLAVCAGLNDPHAVLPHVTVHRTPAFALSFVTFAVMLVVPLAARVEGGCAANVTEIAGGVGGFGLELDPPHPTITSTRVVTAVSREIFRRFLIAHLPARRSRYASAVTRRSPSRELEIRSCATHRPSTILTTSHSS